MTPDSHPKRVLVVEDDAFVALDVSDLLEEANFTVIGCVGTTREALALLEDQVPDLAVLDFNLRQDTSQAIAARLEELNVPYLFLSGRSRDQIDTARPLMRKPFLPDALIDAVRDLEN